MLFLPMVEARRTLGVLRLNAETYICDEKAEHERQKMLIAANNHDRLRDANEQFVDRVMYIRRCHFDAIKDEGLDGICN